MEEEIIYSKAVEDFLFDLTYILFKKEYFGFFESSAKYVQDIVDEINNKLPKLTHHETPNELKHHGKYYVKIKGSKRTMWYVFFNKNKNRFIVKFIANNHAPKSAYLQHL